MDISTAIAVLALISSIALPLYLARRERRHQMRDREAELARAEAERRPVLSISPERTKLVVTNVGDAEALGVHFELIPSTEGRVVDIDFIPCDLHPGQVKTGAIMTAWDQGNDARVIYRDKLGREYREPLH